MNRNITALALLSACSTLTFAGTLDQYTDRASFNLNTGAQSIEDFESEPLAQIAMPSVFDSGLSADLTSGFVSSFIEAGDPDGYGFQNATLGGRRYLRFGQNTPGTPGETGSYSVEFSFGQSVNAFGFDISGFQPTNAADGFNLSLFSNGQLIEDIFIFSDQGALDLNFYGFVSDMSFDSARVFIPVLNSNSVADYVAFDDVTWGVPSPSSASLLALGGLIASRRRR